MPDTSFDSRTSRQRAAPLSATERRAAIIAATVPLVRQYGFDVSTRQIAQAAGIAEGTIFRVFDDKNSLLRQAVHAALDPVDAERRLEEIDLTAPLAERILAAAELLQQRMKDALGLAAAVGLINFQQVDHADHQVQHQRLTALLAGLFEPDREKLRCEPVEAARLLQIVAFGGSHPRLAQGRTMTPAEIVDLLLNGIRHRASGEAGPC